MSDIIYYDNEVLGLEVVINETDSEVNPEGFIFVRNGEDEIKGYVENIIKPDLDNFTQEKKDEITDKVEEEVSTAKKEIDFYIDNTTKPDIEAYVGEKKQELTALSDELTEAFDTNAAEKQASVDASAEAAAVSAAAAKVSEDNAKASADQAKETLDAAVETINTTKEAAVSEFNTNAAEKTTSFNNNAAEKQAAVDKSAADAANSASNSEKWANEAEKFQINAAYGNVGDVQYTVRKTVPNGGAWCDGSEFSQEQYPRIYQMLVDGLLSVTSFSDWDAKNNANGCCGFFGLDTAAKKFKVPRLNNVYLKSGFTDPNFNDQSLPNHSHKIYVSNNGNPNGGADTGGDRHYWFNLQSGTINTGNASETNGIYRDGVEVNPKHIIYRPYIILYASELDIDVSQAELARDEAKASAAEAKTSETNAQASAAAAAASAELTANRTDAFNENAAEKKKDFDDNAALKVSSFDENAADKLNLYNTNATEKTDTFNENAANKQNEIDESAEEARKWAVGSLDERPEGSAKHWSENAKMLTDGALNGTDVPPGVRYARRNVILSLSGEVLTLKAGSKVFTSQSVADTIEQDINFTMTFEGKVPCYVLLLKDTKEIILISKVDTNLTKDEKNRIYYNGQECYLPLGLATRNVAKKSTLDDVFNGQGFCLNMEIFYPGLVGYVPNGLNEDGSFNYIEYELDKPYFRSYTWFADNQTSYFDIDSESINSSANYNWTEQDSVPNSNVENALWLDTLNNYLYRCNGGVWSKKRGFKTALIVNQNASPWWFQSYLRYKPLQVISNAGGQMQGTLRFRSNKALAIDGADAAIPGEHAYVYWDSAEGVRYADNYVGRSGNGRDYHVMRMRDFNGVNMMQIGISRDGTTGKLRYENTFVQIVSALPSNPDTETFYFVTG